MRCHSSSTLYTHSKAVDLVFVLIDENSTEDGQGERWQKRHKGSFLEMSVQKGAVGSVSQHSTLPFSST
jgi:hypothetical protein